MSLEARHGHHGHHAKQAAEANPDAEASQPPASGVQRRELLPRNGGHHHHHPKQAAEAEPSSSDVQQRELLPRGVMRHLMKHIKPSANAAPTDDSGDALGRRELMSLEARHGRHGHHAKQAVEANPDADASQSPSSGVQRRELLPRNGGHHHHHPKQAAEAKPAADAEPSSSDVQQRELLPRGVMRHLMKHIKISANAAPTDDSGEALGRREWMSFEARNAAKPHHHKTPAKEEAEEPLAQRSFDDMEYLYAREPYVFSSLL